MENAESQSEKTYTQEEVDKLVADQRADERAKAEQETAAKKEENEAKERELHTKAERLKCEQFIDEMKMPKEFLNIFDTGDSAGFMNTAQKATDAIVKELRESGVVWGWHWPHLQKRNNDDLETAFSGRNKHKPKTYERERY